MRENKWVKKKIELIILNFDYDLISLVKKTNLIKNYCQDD